MQCDEIPLVIEGDGCDGGGCAPAGDAGNAGLVNVEVAGVEGEGGSVAACVQGHGHLTLEGFE